MKRILQVYQNVDEIIDKELTEHGADIACKKGCDNCCKHIGFPILEPEAFAIAAHIKEQANNEINQTIRKQIDQYEPGQQECPFLVDTTCGVYAVRPLACRTHYIHGETCTPEDVTSDNRINDIHRYPESDMVEAHLPLMDCYGIKGREQQVIAFCSGVVEMASMPMNSINWRGILDHIEKQEA